jgi:hypothetical protein
VRRLRKWAQIARVRRWSSAHADALVAGGIAAGSRLMLFAVAFLASWQLGNVSVDPRITYPARAATFHGLLGHLINPWAHWDGVWYIRIAANGYEHAHSPAFFPLYPALVRLGSFFTGGSYEIAGILLSLSCFAAAMVVLYRMTARLYGTRSAALAVGLISLAPTSFYFQAVHSESLFLFLTVLSISFGLQHRWGAASIAGFFAALTRNTGILLVVPLLMLYWQQRGWSLRRLRGLRLRRMDARLGWLALIPAGIVVYMAYLYAHVGDPLAFMTAQENWHRQLGIAPVTFLRGMRTGIAGLHPLFLHASDHTFASLLPGHHLLAVVAELTVPAIALVAVTPCSRRASDGCRPRWRSSPHSRYWCRCRIPRTRVRSTH